MRVFSTGRFGLRRRMGSTFSKNVGKLTVVHNIRRTAGGVEFLRNCVVEKCVWGWGWVRIDPSRRGSMFDFFCPCISHGGPKYAPTVKKTCSGPQKPETTSLPAHHRRLYIPLKGSQGPIYPFKGALSGSCVQVSTMEAG